MKKVGIVTIIDFDNYGNRLQNYACQEFIKKMNYDVETICNKKGYSPTMQKLRTYFKEKVKIFAKFCLLFYYKGRYNNFSAFNKKINFTNKIIDADDIDQSLNDRYNFFIVGSDQVWNSMFKRLNNIDLLSFAEPNKRISLAASFGISELPKEYHKKLKKELSKFKAISVREDVGKKIIEDVVGRKDVEVLVDPTMLLTTEEWNKVSRKPKMLKSDRFILNYFLGGLSKDRKEEINRFAKENNCEVINMLDKKNPFYACGPSEFLYLEKNAFLICTDSFHSSVFAILYNRPFIVFDRDGYNTPNMNSRLDTLLSKFKLEDRKYKGKITKKDLKCNYTEAYKILKKEREKSIEWLKKALDIE